MRVGWAELRDSLSGLSPSPRPSPVSRERVFSDREPIKVFSEQVNEHKRCINIRLDPVGHSRKAFPREIGERDSRKNAWIPGQARNDEC